MATLTEQTLALHKNDCPKPFILLKDIITQEEIQAARNFFQDVPSYSQRRDDYSVSIVGHRPNIPTLEARIHALFPDMMWFACQYFAGEKKNGVYGGWHTDLNGGKPFKGNPNLITIWIPFQTLTEETGGRLWLYGGPKAESVLDVLDSCSKKTMALQ